MSSTKATLCIGDKVFAKMQGYPPWPAKIIGISPLTGHKTKFQVYFYGTYQTGTLKENSVFPYLENKAKFSKPRKNKKFNKALREIEHEVVEDVSVLNSSVQGLSIGSADCSKEQGTSRTTSPYSSDYETITLDSSEDDEENINSVSALGQRRKKRGASGVTKKRRIKQNRESIIESVEDEESRGHRIARAPSVKFIEAKIDEGETVPIPLDLNRPIHYDKNALCTWDALVLKHAQTIKSRLEAGDKSLDPFEEMNQWTNSQLVQCLSHAPRAINDTVRLLNSEAQLLDISIDIKLSLSVNNPNPVNCLALLDRLNGLEVTRLMLLKNSEIVHVIRKVRNYVGNINNWELNEQRLHEFKENAAQIRVKADAIYTRFKALFNFIESSNFFEFFKEEERKFESKTEDMSVQAILALTEEPA